MRPMRLQKVLGSKRDVFTSDTGKRAGVSPRRDVPKNCGMEGVWLRSAGRGERVIEGDQSASLHGKEKTEESLGGPARSGGGYFTAEVKCVSLRKGLK